MRAGGRWLVIPPHRDGGEAQYVERPVPRERAGGYRLAGLLGTMRAGLDQDWPVERVARLAAACGYGAAATLRHHFRSQFGISPGAYRRRFAAG